MKAKKLEIKKLTIVQLAAVCGGEGEIETVQVCNTVQVDQMPALRTFGCKPPQPIAER